MSSSSSEPPTAPGGRLDRVREILNDAQGSSNPSYQGYGRFWLLPIEQFVAVRLYGVPMFAAANADSTTGFPTGATSDPSPSTGCCGNEPTSQIGSSSAMLGRGRGQASGLIIGLRGEYPFDGSQLERLPWGGVAVSEADITFIEQWIDDGCPPTDAADHDATPASCGGQPTRVSSSDRHALAAGRLEHPLSTRPTNELRDAVGAGRVRKNIECLSSTEIANLRAAVGAMQRFDTWSTYDPRSFRYWANIHANNCQHGWEQFLPWHRMYLYQFEQQLQDIDPTVTLPYWDWPLNSEDVAASIKDQGSDGGLDNGVVPEIFRCWVDDGMISRLADRVDPAVTSKLKKIVGAKYSSGNRLYSAAGLTFSGSPADDAIMSELRLVNPLWNRNRWPGGNKDLIFESYPTPDDVDRILQLPNFFSFGSGPANNHFFGALENLHNLVHNFTGGINPNSKVASEPSTGDMVSAGTTARDAIFWAHHSNVDRLWETWQTNHPGVGPDDPTDVLTPWPYNVGQVDKISRLGYEYAASVHSFETDHTTPITTFKSAAAGVRTDVVTRHRSAEVHLHGVRYATEGGAFIRVFLNEPNASASTPTRGNDNFVAQLATFSGDCLGGPDHCAPPTGERRAFDIRQRHRKTPGNFRVDASDAVARLIAKGSTDFTVQLVVLGLDGEPKSDSLRLGAVSLNFKD